MKTPAKPHAADWKRMVATGYDACAQAYLQARAQADLAPVRWLKNRLPNRAQALDIGCGAGIPFSRELAKRFALTGVDISAEQIRLARQNVPHASFFHSDIMALDFPAESFDAITAFYLLFHLPRTEHARLLHNIARWLKPGGYLLITLAAEEEEGYTEDDFFGETMYWSHYAFKDYTVMLAEAGLRLLHSEEIGSGYTADLPPEEHPLIFAQK